MKSNLNMSIDDELIELPPTPKYKPEDIYKKEQEKNEIQKKMQELEKEMQEVDKQIESKTNIKLIKEYVKEKRNEFVFKVVYEDGNFYELSAKNYIKAILRNESKKQNNPVKDIKIKTIENCIWFKTDKPLILDWIQKKVESKPGYGCGCLITQLRHNKFFDDL